MCDSSFSLHILVDFECCPVTFFYELIVVLILFILLSLFFQESYPETVFSLVLELKFVIVSMDLYLITRNFMSFCESDYFQ